MSRQLRGCLGLGWIDRQLKAIGSATLPRRLFHSIPLQYIPPGPPAPSNPPPKPLQLCHVKTGNSHESQLVIQFSAIGTTASLLDAGETTPQTQLADVRITARHAGYDKARQR